MYKTRSLVDWLSFTVPAFPEYFDPNGVFPEYATMALVEHLGAMWLYMLGDIDAWEVAKSRPPYTTAIHRNHLFYIYAGASQTHVLVEISGKGCEQLRKDEQLIRLLKKARSRATRVDIAHDFETKIRPMQVYDDGFSSKFKAATTIVSPTGETFYLGSPKSEKRVRVYTYNAPHPRAGLLRFEYVFRKKSAKMIVGRLCDEELSEVVKSCIATFGWKSKFLEQEQSEGLTNVREERGSAKTLRWVLMQVAPAIRRLIEEDVIVDPEEFFKTNFMP